MSDVLPEYEVLFADLQNLSLGNYLTSRDFKLYMTKENLYEDWKDKYQSVKDNRTRYVLMSDYSSIDACDTFTLYLNEISYYGEYENIVTGIILQFIDWKEEETNFQNLLQSIEISHFGKGNLNKIVTAVEKHIKKKLPKKIEQNNMESDPIGKSKSLKDVFIVHGHNDELKHKVARVIEKLKLNPIILNEQSNEGSTIIEKFEKYSNVAFAIVLLTFDDYGYSKSSEEKNKRARQNVILELGFFLASLGRKNILPLYENGVELPSDINGVLYTKIDEDESWKYKLVRELKAAGFKVSADDIL